MEHPPTTNLSTDPPPFPPSPPPSKSIDLSPLEFVLALVAIITIPALIYTFFYSIKCPSSTTFRRRNRRHMEGLDATSTSITANPPPPFQESSDGGKEEVVSFKKDTHVKEMGSECPVCLSLFVDGEDVRQLSGCKHSFHVGCIDMWLVSHSNCPVCRASVGDSLKPGGSDGSSSNVNVRTSGNNNINNYTRRRDGDDFQQGLPDAASLV